MSRCKCLKNKENHKETDYSQTFYHKFIIDTTFLPPEISNAKSGCFDACDFGEMDSEAGDSVSKVSLTYVVEELRLLLWSSIVLSLIHFLMLIMI